MTTIDSAVETADLSKSFGRIIAIQDVSLSVASGHTYGLLGPSGSGKSTFIRLALGLVRPTSGTVRVLKNPPTHREIMSEVGYMPQAAALYPELTARENVDFFARLYGAQTAKTDHTLELMELADRSDSPVTTLSGGMQRRVSLACALVHSPRLLFLDEPTVGLDPRLRVAFWDHFKQLNSSGVTIVVSTHIMDEADRCDRLGLLREGRLIAEGTPEELRSQSGAASLEEAFLFYAGEQPDESEAS